MSGSVGQVVQGRLEGLLVALFVVGDFGEQLGGLLISGLGGLAGVVRVHGGGLELFPLMASVRLAAVSPTSPASRASSAKCSSCSTWAVLANSSAKAGVTVLTCLLGVEGVFGDGKRLTLHGAAQVIQRRTRGARWPG